MTSTPRHSEAAFETVIEHHPLGHGAIQVIAEFVEALGTVPPDP